MKTRKFDIISIVTAISFAIMIFLNALANILPINGQTTGSVSDAYVNLFTPDAYTFSIWGLIYLLLGIYVVYQLGFFRKDYIVNRNNLFNQVGILFSLSSIVNSLWILAWHYDKMLLSTILIVTILVLLIAINVIIKKEDLSLKEKFFIRLPFSVYFGWITVATIANITVYLVSIGWKGFGIGENIWAMIILLVGVLIGGLTTIKQRDIAYGLVLIWAYGGIYSKHISESGWNSEYPLVIATITISLGILVLTLLYTFYRKGKDRKIL